MSQEALEQVMDRWTNDPNFRQQVETDPEGTIRREGFSLDASELEAVRNMASSLPDQALKGRDSKSNMP